MNLIPGLKVGGIILTGLLALFTAAALAANSYDSDAKLERDFRKHRGEYQKIAEMAQSDGPFVRIATDFTRPDTDYSSPEKKNWISQERLAEYRVLFRSIGVPDGIGKSENSPDEVFFANSARGFILSSSYKGIAYCPTVPKPLLESLDRRPLSDLYDKRGHVIAYKKIEDRWYLYYEEF